MLVKKIGLAALSLLLLGYLVVILKSAQEYPSTSNFAYEHLSGLGYHLTVKSIDPDDQRAAIAVKPVFHEFGSVKPQKSKEVPDCDYLLLAGETTKIKCSFWFEPLIVNDKSTDFLLSGIRNDFLFNAYPDSLNTIGTTMKPTPPEEQEFNFWLIGNPIVYPFDKYLLIGAIQERVRLKNNGRIVPSADVEEGAITYSFGDPGYVFRPATKKDLFIWSSQYTSPEADFIKSGYEMSEPVTWKRHRFAIVIERSYFVRNLTILIVLIAVIASVAAIQAIRQDKATEVIAAHFLSLWALHAVITSGAPKTANYVDYAILIIYVLTVCSMVLKFALQKSVNNAP